MPYQEKNSNQELSGTALQNQAANADPEKKDQPYNTEILSVGTELLLGHVTNTDARDISEMLSMIGVNVRYHTVVGDNPVRLLDCIRIARQRANLIITTGGLGPTCDDLTKQTLCKAFELPLELDQEEYRALYEYMSARRPYTENNTQQAMLPAGCTVFHNTCGTAPGCAFEKGGITVIMLPGPPKECRTMMEKSVLPYLKQRCGEVIVSHSVRIFGVSESGVDDMFAGEMNSMTNPTMAPYAKEADCLLQITAKASGEEEAEAMCAPVMAHVMERLGDAVYGVDVENLEEAAVKLLLREKKTLAIAEGFTGGALSARFTAVAGGAELLKTGFVLTSAGLSEEFVSAFADNIRASSGADLSVAVGGEEEGRFCVALSTPEETVVKKVETGKLRPVSFRRQMAGNHAFDLLRRYLSGRPVL